MESKLKLAWVWICPLCLHRNESDSVLSDDESDCDSDVHMLSNVTCDFCWEDFAVNADGEI